MTKGFPPREIKVIWKSLSLSLIVKDLFSESDNSERQSLILTKKTHLQISVSEGMQAAILLCRGVWKSDLNLINVFMPWESGKQLVATVRVVWHFEILCFRG